MGNVCVKTLPFGAYLVMKILSGTWKVIADDVKVRDIKAVSFAVEVGYNVEIEH
jgi:hypothetical protein